MSRRKKETLTRPLQTAEPAQTILVIGDGWSSTLAVAALAQSAEEVIWMTGTGKKLLAPLPTVESGRPAEVLLEILKSYKMGEEESAPGTYLMEFRNKAFKKPQWTQSTDFAEVMEELLWKAERRFVPVHETAFSTGVETLLSELREKLLSLPQVKRIEGVIVNEISSTDETHRVKLASGEEYQAARLIYADDWMDLRRIQGAPKEWALAKGKLTLTEAFRKWQSVGALQVVFKHKSALGVEASQGFLIGIPKESTKAHMSKVHVKGHTKIQGVDHADDSPRHVWGYFPDPSTSVWTLLLTEDEAENNHEIMKKLRKVKQVLAKAFHSMEWLSGAVGTEPVQFMDTVQSESVRFAEDTVYSGGEPVDSILKSARGMEFLTDAFGISHALNQVGTFLPESEKVIDEVKVTAVDNPAQTHELI